MASKQQHINSPRGVAAISRMLNPNVASNRSSPTGPATRNMASPARMTSPTRMASPENMPDRNIQQGKQPILASKRDNPGLKLHIPRVTSSPPKSVHFQTEQPSPSKSLPSPSKSLPSPSKSLPSPISPTRLTPSRPHMDPILVNKSLQNKVNTPTQASQNGAPPNHRVPLNEYEALPNVGGESPIRTPPGGPLPHSPISATSRSQIPSSPITPTADTRTSIGSPLVLSPQQISSTADRNRPAEKASPADRNHPADRNRPAEKASPADRNHPADRNRPAEKASPRKTSIASLRNHVAEIIQCAICIENPSDPRCLPCLHTFCLGCLEVFYKRSLGANLFGADQIQCPECCQMCTLPPGGLTDLQSDFRVKQLEDIFANAVDLQDDFLSLSPPVSDPGSTPPASNPLYTGTIENKAEELHYLMEKSPREAKDFINRLSHSERRKVSNKLLDGRPALCVACDLQIYDVMVHLIEHGRADVNQIVVGTGRGGKQIESSILIQAAAECDLTAVQVLVSHGAVVNQADGEGITPLFVACLEGSMDMVEYLIDVGAEVSQSTNKYGAAPIMAASSKGHLNILKCLVDKGADVNTTQKDGYTPLMAACHKSKDPDQTAAFLLTQWAEINLADSRGRTAVMYAVQRGSADTLSILLMNGAHVNVTDGEGRTALHTAISRGHLDMIQLLIDHGADPNIKTKQGTTCLDLASHNPNMMKILKTYKKIKRKK